MSVLKLQLEGRKWLVVQRKQLLRLSTAGNCSRTALSGIAAQAPVMQALRARRELLSLALLTGMQQALLNKFTN